MLKVKVIGWNCDFFSQKVNISFFCRSSLWFIAFSDVILWCLAYSQWRVGEYYLVGTATKWNVYICR